MIMTIVNCSWRLFFFDFTFHLYFVVVVFCCQQHFSRYDEFFFCVSVCNNINIFGMLSVQHLHFFWYAFSNNALSGTPICAGLFFSALTHLRMGDGC